MNFTTLLSLIFITTATAQSLTSTLTITSTIDPSSSSSSSSSSSTTAAFLVTSIGDTPSYAQQTSSSLSNTTTTSTTLISKIPMPTYSAYPNTTTIIYASNYTMTTKSSGSGATSTLVNNGWAIGSGGVGGSLMSAGTSGAGKIGVPVLPGLSSAAAVVVVVVALVGCLV